MLEVLASQRDGYPLISGHRGGAAYAPENTMAAFRKGKELGADLLELDIQLTKDGHVVVFHDEALERTTNGKGLLAGHTLAQLRELDAGSWFGPQYAGEPIPTFEEVAAWAAAEGVRLNVEMKSGPYPHFDIALAVKVVEILETYGRIEDSLCISFDHILIAEVKRRAPGLACAVNYTARLVDPVGVARAAGADILNIHRQFVSPEIAAIAHKAGLGLQCYCDDPEQAKFFTRIGVDFMDSDHPDVIRAAVRSVPREEVGSLSAGL